MGNGIFGHRATPVIVNSLIPPLPGDINGDRVVNLKDAILALQVLTGTIPAEMRPDYAYSGVDVDGNNRIGSIEVIYILQKVGGLRP